MCVRQARSWDLILGYPLVHQVQKVQRSAGLSFFAILGIQNHHRGRLHSSSTSHGLISMSQKIPVGS